MKCHKAKSRERYQKNKKRPERRQRQCLCCKESKTARGYHPHSGRADGRTRICRACFKKITKGVRQVA